MTPPLHFEHGHERQRSPSPLAGGQKFAPEFSACDSLNKNISKPQFCKFSNMAFDPGSNRPKQCGDAGEVAGLLDRRKCLGHSDLNDSRLDGRTHGRGRGRFSSESKGDIRALLDGSGKAPRPASSTDLSPTGSKMPDSSERWLRCRLRVRAGSDEVSVLNGCSHVFTATEVRGLPARRTRSVKPRLFS